jgi:hypothetical protein
MYSARGAFLGDSALDTNPSLALAAVTKPGDAISISGFRGASLNISASGTRSNSIINVSGSTAVESSTHAAMTIDNANRTAAPAVSLRNSRAPSLSIIGGQGTSAEFSITSHSRTGPALIDIDANNAGGIVVRSDTLGSARSLMTLQKSGTSTAAALSIDVSGNTLGPAMNVVGDSYNYVAKFDTQTSQPAEIRLSEIGMQVNGDDSAFGLYSYKYAQPVQLWSVESKDQNTRLLAYGYDAQSAGTPIEFATYQARGGIAAMQNLLSTATEVYRMRNYAQIDGSQQIVGEYVSEWTSAQNLAAYRVKLRGAGGVLAERMTVSPKSFVVYTDTLANDRVSFIDTSDGLRKRLTFGTVTDDIVYTGFVRDVSGTGIRANLSSTSGSFKFTAAADGGTTTRELLSINGDRSITLPAQSGARSAKILFAGSSATTAATYTYTLPDVGGNATILIDDGSGLATSQIIPGITVYSNSGAPTALFENREAYDAKQKIIANVEGKARDAGNAQTTFAAVRMTVSDDAPAQIGSVSIDLRNTAGMQTDLYKFGTVAAEFERELTANAGISTNLITPRIPSASLVIGSTNSTDVTVRATTVYIDGNLEISGTSSIIDSTHLDVKDNQITVNKNGNRTSSQNAGILIESSDALFGNGYIHIENAGNEFHFKHPDNQFETRLSKLSHVGPSYFVVSDPNYQVGSITYDASPLHTKGLQTINSSLRITQNFEVKDLLATSTVTGSVRIGNGTIGSLTNGLNGRKLVFYEAIADVNDFSGISVSTSGNRYQSAASARNHIFYASDGTTTPREVFGIYGGTGVYGSFSSSFGGGIRIPSPTGNYGYIQVDDFALDRVYILPEYFSPTALSPVAFIVTTAPEFGWQDIQGGIKINSVSSLVGYLSVGNNNVNVFETSTASGNNVTRFSSAVSNSAKISLYNSGAVSNSSYDYTGFGVTSTNDLAYNVVTSSAAHKFFGASSTNLLATIPGDRTGLVLHTSNTIGAKIGVESGLASVFSYKIPCANEGKLYATAPSNIAETSFVVAHPTATQKIYGSLELSGLTTPSAAPVLALYTGANSVNAGLYIAADSNETTPTTCVPIRIAGQSNSAVPSIAFTPGTSIAQTTGIFVYGTSSASSTSRINLELPVNSVANTTLASKFIVSALNDNQSIATPLVLSNNVYVGENTSAGYLKSSTSATNGIDVYANSVLRATFRGDGFAVYTVDGAYYSNIASGQTSANRTVTIPNLAADADFLMNRGDQTINGVMTIASRLNFASANNSIRSGGTTLDFIIGTPAANQLTIGSTQASFGVNVSAPSVSIVGTGTNSVTISSVQNAARTLSVPQLNNNGESFVVTDTISQTIKGAVTVNGLLTASGGATITGNAGVTGTVSAGAVTVSNATITARDATVASYTLPTDAATTGDFVITTGAQIITGQKRLRDFVSYGVANTVANTTFTPISLVDIGSGADSSGGNQVNQLSFAWRNGGYRHFINSRHANDGSFTNALDFYINTSSVATDSATPDIGNIRTLTINRNGIGVFTLVPFCCVDITRDSNNNALAGIRINGVSSSFPGIVCASQGPIIRSCITPNSPSTSYHEITITATNGQTRTSVVPNHGAATANFLMSEGTQTINSVNQFLQNTSFGSFPNPQSLIDISGGSDSVGGAGVRQLSFRFAGDGYRHYVRTRHDSQVNSNGNSIDFFINNDTIAGGSSNYGVGNILVTSITARGVGVFNTSPTYAVDIANSTSTSGGIRISGTVSAAAPAITLPFGDNVGAIRAGTGAAYNQFEFASIGSGTRRSIIPDHGAASASFVMSEGAQAINGTKTFSGDIIVSSQTSANASIDITPGTSSAHAVSISGTNMGEGSRAALNVVAAAAVPIIRAGTNSTNYSDVVFAALGANQQRLYSVPNVSTATGLISADFVMSEGAQVINGAKTFEKIGVQNSVPQAYLEIGGGIGGSFSSNVPQFGFYGIGTGTTAGFRHFVQTRHANEVSSNNNGIDFYINNSAVANNSIIIDSGDTGLNRNSFSITCAGVGVFNRLPTYCLDVKQYNVATSNGAVRIDSTNATAAQPALTIIAEDMIPIISVTQPASSAAYNVFFENNSNGTTYEYLVPNVLADASFVMSDGNQTIGGNKTFIGNNSPNSVPITLTPNATNSFCALKVNGAGLTTATRPALDVVVGSTNTPIIRAGISAGTSATATVSINMAMHSAARTYTLADVGGGASFVMTAGNQTIGGNKTFNSPASFGNTVTFSNLTTFTGGTGTGSIPITLTPNATNSLCALKVNGAGLTTSSRPAFDVVVAAVTTPFIRVGISATTSATNTLSLVTNITSASRTYNFTDVGANASFVMTEGDQSINGNKTFTNLATFATANITDFTASSINNATIDVINSDTAQTLNIGTTASTTVSKAVNIGSTTNDVTAGTALVRIGRNAMLEFGAGIVGKEANAGKIGYGAFDPSLNIVGAGAGTNRLIRMWDFVGINTSPTTDAALTTSGAITIGGSSRLNLFDSGYSIRAETSALRFYVNNGTTSMLNLDNNTVISTSFPIRTTSNIGFTNGSFSTLLTAGVQTANRTITFPTVSADADVVLTQSNQTVAGIKTFADGARFGATGTPAGYTPTTLSVYEEVTTTFTFSGSFAGTVNAVIRRIGTVVIIDLASLTNTSGGTGPSTTAAGALAARFCPASTVQMPIHVNNNGTVLGAISVAADGTIRLGINATLGDFNSGAGTNRGTVRSSIHYSISI